MEKITVSGGALPVYKFTLPEGVSFRDYTGISAQFLVDGENYCKSMRVRAYGNYQPEFFVLTDDFAFLDFSRGENDKNAPYLVSNVYGSHTGIETISEEAKPNSWFTIKFPLYGKRHQSYNPANFPPDDADGDFYFALGLSVTDYGSSLTYYIKNVELVSDDGTRRVLSSGSGFEKPSEEGSPSFVGYGADITELRREPAASAAIIAVPKEKSGPVRITVDAQDKRQWVRGFGGMSNAWTSPVMNEEDITTMYGEKGLGYTIFRIIIYHDPSKWGELLAVAKKAQGYGAAILASPWTPPPEWKSNYSHIGGHLLPEYYPKYAEHLASFVRYMADNGVIIDALSLQNEPDIQVNYDSCDWTPEQMLEFVKRHGRDMGDVKIIPSESFQFRRAFTSPVLNDPEAVRNFDIIGGHIYGGGLTAYPEAAEKGKEIWMTEHLMNTQGNYANDLTWKSALAVAKEIHDCMEADFNAYIWWYLKRFYSMIGDGENGSVAGEILRRGYVMSHYAKFATGRQRVGVSADGNPNVLASAYEGDDDLCMVIINMGSKPSKALIDISQKFQSVSAVESTENFLMRQKPLHFSPGKNSVSFKLEPQSIISLRFVNREIFLK
jgi:O-glycosyl hydrolase